MIPFLSNPPKSQFPIPAMSCRVRTVSCAGQSILKGRILLENVYSSQDVQKLETDHTYSQVFRLIFTLAYQESHRLYHYFDE